MFYNLILLYNNLYNQYFLPILGPILGMRHVQSLLLFFCIVAMYVSRLNVGVAVVAMTNADTTNPDFPVSFIYL